MARMLVVYLAQAAIVSKRHHDQSDIAWLRNVTLDMTPDDLTYEESSHSFALVRAQTAVQVAHAWDVVHTVERRTRDAGLTDEAEALASEERRFKVLLP